MNAIAARLIARLLVIVLGVGAATEIFVTVFAPRLLLLDPMVVLGTLPLALWVAIIMIVWHLAWTLFLARDLRSVLRALAVGTAAVAPEDLLKLYAMPLRLTMLTLTGAALVSAATMFPPLRPTTNDPYTQVALILLTMTIVSAAALPMYIMLRVSVARVLELAPSHAAAAVLAMQNVRRWSRVQARLLVAVAGPVAFVGLGASLLVYAHARAFDTAARESDGAELSRAVLEPVGGNVAGLKEATDVARQRGFEIELARGPGEFTTTHTDEGMTLLTVPLDNGHAVLQFQTTMLSPLTGVYMLLALVAAALAGILGARLGAAFDSDLALATRAVKHTGVADVIRGTQIQREARFGSIINLLRAIDALGGVFREFAAAQEKSIVARAAAERMRGLFLASISHDLKGPLNSILGFAELVRRSPLSDAQKESLAIIEQRGLELLTLIQTILDSARAEANELELAPELTMVGDVVMSAVLEARELAVGASVDIVGEIQGGVPRLMVDPQRTIQALTAVIMTSVRFSDKGTVRVRATVPAGTDKVCIDVEGSGRAMASAELEKIFEAFKYADRARRMGSLGLGLSLARSIVELHGGSIEVSEMTGGAAVFRVWLPAAVGR